MLRRFLAFLPLALLLALPASPQFGAPAPKHSAATDKNVWNYDGGLVMMTDGAIPDGPCFRLTGKLTAPNFFDNLKRIDTKTGPVIHRGNDLVTEFPEHMQLLFEMYDTPCMEPGTAPIGPRVYLNKAIMTSLHINFFWKRGVELRPAKGIALKSAEARQIPPYSSEAKDLPDKFEWWFDFDVPSAGVPVTDSLVLILHTADNRVAARVAARL
jgi:hypothetical protein